MPCYETRDESGSLVSIVCVRGQRSTPPCSCGRPAVALCDYIVEKPAFGQTTVKTCDVSMCRDHRVHVGPNRDFCIEHSLAPDATQEVAAR